MTAAAIPPAILPRVGALVRLLGSDVDGEALGAARALRRTLQGAGVDFHALAEAVERPCEREASRLSDWDRSAQPGDVVLDRQERIRVAAALRRGLADESLSDWQRDFCASIAARLEAGHGKLTEKQVRPLRRLLRSIGEASAWA